MLGNTKLYSDFFFGYKLLSWEKSRLNVLRLQKRIFKSILVGDVKMCLAIQRILLLSNSARFLSIRFVLQFYVNRKNIVNDFSNKIFLNSLLFNNVFSWYPSKITIKSFRLYHFSRLTSGFEFSVSDLCWQSLVLLALLPAHDVIFSPLNFGSRFCDPSHFLQRVLILNFSNSSFGMKKKIIKLEFNSPILSFDYKYLLNKLVTLRIVKIIIFRFLKLGLLLSFDFDNFLNINLFSFLYNLLFDKLFYNLDYLQFKSTFIIFLFPQDNFYSLCELIESSLCSKSILVSKKNLNILSLQEGFELFNWCFKLFNNDVICIPSFASYSLFLKRVKIIINNSNYGAVSLIYLSEIASFIC